MDVFAKNLDKVAIQKDHTSSSWNFFPGKNSPFQQDITGSGYRNRIFVENIQYYHIEATVKKHWEKCNFEFSLFFNRAIARGKV